MAITALLGAMEVAGAKWTALIAAISAVLLGLNMFHAKMLDLAQRKADAGTEPRWAWTFARPTRVEIIGVTVLVLAVAVLTPWLE